MLGCVKDVSDFEVTVGLPCGLQGFLSISNICDSYTKLLTEQLDSTDEVGKLYFSGSEPFLPSVTPSLFVITEPPHSYVLMIF